VRRRRSWRPGQPIPAPSASAAARTVTPIVTTDVEPFTADARDHIAVFQPMCTIKGCTKRAMRWCRCICGHTISRCSGHNAEGVTKDRHEHMLRCVKVDRDFF